MLCGSGQRELAGGRGGGSTHTLLFGTSRATEYKYAGLHQVRLPSSGSIPCIFRGKRRNVKGGGHVGVPCLVSSEDPLRFHLHCLVPVGVPPRVAETGRDRGAKTTIA